MTQNLSDAELNRAVNADFASLLAREPKAERTPTPQPTGDEPIHPSIAWSLVVECPICHAGPDVRCFRPFGGRPMAGLHGDRTTEARRQGHRPPVVK
jgi:hypothetical protein